MQEIINLKIEEVVPYENNPRLNEKGIEVVQKSIEEYGFINPIVVDKDNIIIVGHTRFEASKRLGYEEVPCIVADDLTEEQVKAFRIMDNKSSEYSEWDMDKLKAEIEDLDYSEFELDLTGFNEDELSDIMLDLEDVPEESELERERGNLVGTLLTLKKYKIEVTEEECIRMEDYILEYGEENKVLYGFVNRLMDLVEMGKEYEKTLVKKKK